MTVAQARHDLTSAETMKGAVQAVQVAVAAVLPAPQVWQFVIVWAQVRHCLAVASEM
jgi:hypothetical protein